MAKKNENKNLQEEVVEKKPRKTRKAKTEEVVESTNVEVSKQLSPLEEKVLGGKVRNIKYEVISKTDGERFTIEVDQTIPLFFYNNLMSTVEKAYFPSGNYDPFVGRKVIELALFQAFTGISFANDPDAFSQFKSEYIYSPVGIEGDVLSIMPPEFKEFLDKADLLANEMYRSHCVPDEEKKMFEDGSQLFELAGGAIRNIDKTLTAFSKNWDAEGVSMKDAVDALKSAGKIKEDHITQAILDFQLAKAQKEAEKREAEKVDED